MINVTTHTGAECAIRDEVSSVHRIGPRAFAVMLVFDLLLVIGVLMGLLAWSLPTTTPLAAAHDLAPIQEAIRARIADAVDDPLIEVAPGLSVHSSNLRGFSLENMTYYYYVEGEANFDPYSRGTVSAGKIEVLLRDTSGPATIVIYRLL